MFGQTQYKLPGSRKKKKTSEPVQNESVSPSVEVEPSLSDEQSPSIPDDIGIVASVPVEVDYGRSELDYGQSSAPFEVDYGESELDYGQSSVPFEVDYGESSAPFEADYGESIVPVDADYGQPEDDTDFYYTEETAAEPEPAPYKLSPTTSTRGGWFSGLAAAVKMPTISISTENSTVHRMFMEEAEESERKERERWERKNKYKRPIPPVIRGYHPRDESLPYECPPGFIWRALRATPPDFWSIDRLFALIGIGDANDYFIPEIVEDIKEEPLIKPKVTIPDYAESKEREEERKAKEKRIADQKQKEFDDQAAAEDANVNVMRIQEIEPEEGPRGWMFWYGPRWQHFFHGYDTPNSFIFGYPAQAGYRLLHLAFPETYDTIKYESDVGEIHWRSYWLRTKSFFSWMLHHDCIKQIILNGVLLTPFVYWRRLRKTFKVIRNQIAAGTTLYPNVSDHIPRFMRKFWANYLKKKHRRWFFLTTIITFTLSKNCWNLWGKYDNFPTHDYWTRAYEEPLLDGIMVDNRDMPKLTPDLLPPDSIWTPPAKDILKEGYQKHKKATEIRERKREEIYGSYEQQLEDWKQIKESEWKAREENIARITVDRQAIKEAYEQLKRQQRSGDKSL